jgi:hypothetical protein
LQVGTRHRGEVSWKVHRPGHSIGGLLIFVARRLFFWAHGISVLLELYDVHSEVQGIDELCRWVAVTLWSVMVVKECGYIDRYEVLITSWLLGRSTAGNIIVTLTANFG